MNVLDRPQKANRTTKVISAAVLVCFATQQSGWVASVAYADLADTDQKTQLQSVWQGEEDQQSAVDAHNALQEISIAKDVIDIGNLPASQIKVSATNNQNQQVGPYHEVSISAQGNLLVEVEMGNEFKEGSALDNPNPVVKFETLMDGKRLSEFSWEESPLGQVRWLWRHSYSFQVSTDRYSDGEHQLHFVATYKNGKTSEADLHLRIDNLPEPTTPTPATTEKNGTTGYASGLSLFLSEPTANQTYSRNMNVVMWLDRLSADDDADPIGNHVTSVHTFMDGGMVSPAFGFIPDIYGTNNRYYNGWTSIVNPNHFGMELAVNTALYTNGAHQLKVIVGFDDGTYSEVEVPIRILNTVETQRANQSQQAGPQMGQMPNASQYFQNSVEIAQPAQGEIVQGQVALNINVASLLEGMYAGVPVENQESLVTDFHIYVDGVRVPFVYAPNSLGGFEEAGYYDPNNFQMNTPLSKTEYLTAMIDTAQYGDGMHTVSVKAFRNGRQLTALNQSRLINEDSVRLEFKNGNAQTVRPFDVTQNNHARVFSGSTLYLRVDGDVADLEFKILESPRLVVLGPIEEEWGSPHPFNAAVVKTTNGDDPNSIQFAINYKPAAGLKDAPDPAVDTLVYTFCKKGVCSEERGTITFSFADKSESTQNQTKTQTNTTNTTTANSNTNSTLSTGGSDSGTVLTSSTNTSGGNNGGNASGGGATAAASGSSGTTNASAAGGEGEVDPAEGGADPAGGGVNSQGGNATTGGGDEEGGDQGSDPVDEDIIRTWPGEGGETPGVDPVVEDEIRIADRSAEEAAKAAEKQKVIEEILAIYERASSFAYGVLSAADGADKAPRDGQITIDDGNSKDSLRELAERIRIAIQVLTNIQGNISQIVTPDAETESFKQNIAGSNNIGGWIEFLQSRLGQIDSVIREEMNLSLQVAWSDPSQMYVYNTETHSFELNWMSADPTAFSMTNEVSSGVSGDFAGDYLAMDETYFTAQAAWNDPLGEVNPEEYPLSVPGVDGGIASSIMAGEWDFPTKTQKSSKDNSDTVSDPGPILSAETNSQQEGVEADSEADIPFDAAGETGTSTATSAEVSDEGIAPSSETNIGTEAQPTNDAGNIAPSTEEPQSSKPEAVADPSGFWNPVPTLIGRFIGLIDGLQSKAQSILDALAGVPTSTEADAVFAALFQTRGEIEALLPFILQSRAEEFTSQISEILRGALEAKNTLAEIDQIKGALTNFINSLMARKTEAQQDLQDFQSNPNDRNKMDVLTQKYSLAFDVLKKESEPIFLKADPMSQAAAALAAASQQMSQILIAVLEDINNHLTTVLYNAYPYIQAADRDGDGRITYVDIHTADDANQMWNAVDVLQRIGGSIRNIRQQLSSVSLSDSTAESILQNLIRSAGEYETYIDAAVSQMRSALEQWYEHGRRMPVGGGVGDSSFGAGALSDGFKYVDDFAQDILNSGGGFADPLETQRLEQERQMEEQRKLEETRQLEEQKRQAEEQKRLELERLERERLERERREREERQRRLLEQSKPIDRLASLEQAPARQPAPTATAAAPTLQAPSVNNTQTSSIPTPSIAETAVSEPVSMVDSFVKSGESGLRESLSTQSAALDFQIKGTDPIQSSPSASTARALSDNTRVYDAEGEEDADAAAMGAVSVETAARRADSQIAVLRGLLQDGDMSFSRSHILASLQNRSSSASQALLATGGSIAPGAATEAQPAPIAEDSQKA